MEMWNNGNLEQWKFGKWKLGKGKFEKKRKFGKNINSNKQKGESYVYS